MISTQTENEKRLEEIQREKTKLESEELNLEFEIKFDTTMPEINNHNLAKIGQENKVPQEVRLLYEQEFKNMVSEFTASLKRIVRDSWEKNMKIIKNKKK